MEYMSLAVELLDKMQALQRAKPQKNILEAIQGEGFVLRYIASRDCDVLPGDICGGMNVSSARIAQTLNNIEKKGWITRRIDTNDRRRIIISLTPEGKNAAETHYQEVLRVAVNMLDMLGERDATEYVRIMGRLADTVSGGKCGADFVNDA